MLGLRELLAHERMAVHGGRARRAFRVTMLENRRYGNRHLVNTSDIALYVRKAFGVELKPATVRQWAARRRIRTYGHRRERYDLREVVDYAQRQKMIPANKDP